MRRRRFLATAALASSAGCIAGFRGHGTPSPVTDAPAWFQRDPDCANGDRVGYVEHEEARSYGDATSQYASVSYAELPSDSQLLVDFVVERGRAVTCESVPAAYRELATAIHSAMDEWRERNDGEPWGRAIQTNRHYHVVEISLYDWAYP